MTTLAAVVGAAAMEIVVALAAYHRGRRHGRVRLPADLVSELREHKVRCIGEPAERVDLELTLLCEADGAAPALRSETIA
jgi:hypothetical protein